MASEKPIGALENRKDLAGQIRFYKGIALEEKCMAELEEIEKMDVKEDDIWVCSFPRSGTTLAQELVYLVQTMDFERANSVYLDERFPIIEVLAKPLPFYGGLKMVEKLPSPRFIKSHLHHFMLPEQLRAGKGKIIYSLRNPRDTLWSSYKFWGFLNIRDETVTFEEYFERFMSGKVPYSPWGPHVREFWNHRNENVLFLKYEHTVKDMPGTVRKIAEFLKRNLSDAEITRICEHCNIVNMKRNEMVNFGYIKQFLNVDERNGGFINSGTSGAWREHITEEMDRRIDEMIQRHFAGSGLTFNSS